MLPHAYQPDKAGTESASPAGTESATTTTRGLVDRGGGKSVIPALQSFSLRARS